eukprot:TRINITY_DN266_c0_g1_i1.p1 TRINITY_DN266_c0_g1~~TRINITY_DN266_c0_g1_i1.p1  ORF type:complete len:240 (+),score=106.73 TRINITY_DN266_c0_g1_i1:71-721(+)
MPASGILYGHPVSQPSRSVQWYLDYSGNTTVERKVVDLMVGAHKLPEYIGKFPHHEIPGFEMEDGFCFAESLAILKHVSAGDETMQPQTAKEEAILNEYLGRHYSQVRKFSSDVFVHHLLTKDEEKKQAGLVAIKPQLESYNEKLGKQKYILGDKLTLADFLFAPEVDQMEAVGKEVLAPYQNILKYLERLTTDVKGYKECIGGMRSGLEEMLKMM